MGAALTIPSATESVMGSLPGGHTGVGAATNGTFLQVGGALAAAGCVIALIALPSRARNHQQGSQDRPGPGQD